MTTSTKTPEGEFITSLQGIANKLGLSLAEAFGKLPEVNGQSCTKLWIMDKKFEHVPAPEGGTDDMTAQEVEDACVEAKAPFFEAWLKAIDLAETTSDEKVTPVEPEVKSEEPKTEPVVRDYAAEAAAAMKEKEQNSGNGELAELINNQGKLVADLMETNKELSDKVDSLSSIIHDLEAKSRALVNGAAQQDAEIKSLQGGIDFIIGELKG